MKCVSPVAPQFRQIFGGALGLATALLRLCGLCLAPSDVVTSETGESAVAEKLSEPQRIVKSSLSRVTKEVCIADWMIGKAIFKRAFCRPYDLPAGLEAEVSAFKP